MFTTQYQRDIAAMLLFTLLLLQSCQSQLNVVGEEAPAGVPLESEDQQ